MNAYHEISADVIVVGAGISGLTAAFSLIEKEPHMRVLILEASDRIGGRILSRQIEGTHGPITCDLGAQFICSRQKNLLTLMSKLGVAKEIHPKSDLINVVFNDKSHLCTRSSAYSFCSPVEKYELSGFIRKIDEMCSLPIIDPHLQFVSMESFLHQHLTSDTVRQIIQYTILLHLGVDPNDLTVWFYIFFCISTQGITNQLISTANGLFECSIKGGAAELCDAIVNRVHPENIQKECRVTSIVHNLYDVEIRTTKQTYFAYNVIVSVPPTALNQIFFAPKLPLEKLQALRHIVPGRLVKFVVNYEHKFWKHHPADIYFLSGYDSERPILMCLDCSVDDNATLCGFSIKTHDLEQKITAQLAEFIGEAAPISFKSSDHASELLRNAPAYYYNYLGDCVQIFRSERRLFWAGAEASIGWYGHIGGAVLAGQKAALEVLYDLRPALLTIDDMAIAAPTLAAIQRKQRRHHDLFAALKKWYIQVPIGIGLSLCVYVLWKRQKIR